MVNGFEDYDLLYTFLAEHKNCSSKVYISTNYSSNKPWNHAENHLPNQFHCHPEWTWDTRSLNPKAICCYQSSISQFSDAVPKVLTLKVYDGTDYYFKRFYRKTRNHIRLAIQS
jgi:hypothetical protein